MKRITNSVKAGFLGLVVAAAGCANPRHSDSTTGTTPPPAPVSSSPAPQKPDSVGIQGTWKGQVIGVSPEQRVSIVLTGANLEFHGADSADWCKGTFSLREDTNPKQLIGVITDAPDAKVIGQTVQAIHRLEDGVLTITGNPPGSPAPPAAFDAPDARQLVFTIEKP